MARKGRYTAPNHEGNPEFLLNTTKYETSAEQSSISGNVTNVQKGQQGPATIIGEPSLVSMRKNMLPTRREQQQQHVWKSSAVPVQIGLERRLCSSSYSLSHLTDTAYLCVEEEDKGGCVWVCIIYTMVG
uniref:Uncharacterized protein n=1 Tax=Ditylum brightwellii TaxID=49249 RepID=A0A6S9AIN9_9STRA|mmetsp:Transcript_29319/g.38962  ORF Transcript_29319/g.38962 Transcript_29319/m.38962 type:complete len:130 (-) Transcript_29319:419-808(-)